MSFEQDLDIDDSVPTSDETKQVPQSVGTLRGVSKPKEPFDLNSASVTTLNDLSTYASGKKVRLPDFAEGQPFVAMLRRPSMLLLAKQKKIPNTLLAAAGELFLKGGGGSKDTKIDQNTLPELSDVISVVCEASLISPTLEEIKAAGMDLSDDQMMAIFNYTQNGIKAVEPFLN